MIVGLFGSPGEEAEAKSAGVTAAAEDALDEAWAERSAGVVEGEVELVGSGVELAEDTVDVLDVG